MKMCKGNKGSLVFTSCQSAVIPVIYAEKKNSVMAQAEAISLRITAAERHNDWKSMWGPYEFRCAGCFECTSVLESSVFVFVCVRLHMPSPGAGGAACLWHLWSTDFVQVRPLCRYNARLHPELSCTPATPPLAWWSAHNNSWTIMNTHQTFLWTHNLISLLWHCSMRLMLLYSSLLFAPRAFTPTYSIDL